MQFLRECASRLDAGEEAESVLEDMRQVYTTPRCMSSKTSIVRSLCAPTEQYEAALRLKLGLGEGTALVPGAEKALSPKSLRSLPARISESAGRLRITREEKRECKKLGTEQLLRRNRKAIVVQGRRMLMAARREVDAAEEARTLPLLLSLLLLTGRRTCELLSDASRFDPCPDSPHRLLFRGQAKARSAREAYSIPVLHPAPSLLPALRVLRSRVTPGLSHAQASRKYQSCLGRALRLHPVLGQAPKVHSLRGVYSCMCCKLFDWDETDAGATMRMLGHTDLEDSLAYTAFKLGPDFASEPKLAFDGPSRSPP